MLLLVICYVGWGECAVQPSPFDLINYTKAANLYNTHTEKRRQNGKQTAICISRNKTETLKLFLYYFFFVGPRCFPLPFPSLTTLARVQFLPLDKNIVRTFVLCVLLLLLVSRTMKSKEGEEEEETRAKEYKLKHYLLFSFVVINSVVIRSSAFV